MSPSFRHDSSDLYSFFSQAGRGFYIPYYQRNYSWDEENASALMSDIFSGMKRVIRKKTHTVFLGTIILHEESNIKVGVHTDTPNMLTKISTIVDGQQRISSIALLACVMDAHINSLSTQIDSFNNPSSNFSNLKNELDDMSTSFREFYSVDIKKKGVQPPIKPVVIRAGDQSAIPVTDQWTLAGDSTVFYKSNVTNFLAKYIEGFQIEDIPTDERIGGVVAVFVDRIQEGLDEVDETLINELVAANDETGGNFQNFIAYPPNLLEVKSLTPEEQAAFYRGIMTLAVCSFLKNLCNIVIIECMDIDLAFDMFQSLNATGTPLTAFEVFKPRIVQSWGATYPSTIKNQVDRIENVFQLESSASGKEDLTDGVIISSALIFNGEIIGKRFSEERDWLIDTLQPPLDPFAELFIKCIADQAEYRKIFIRPRKSPKDSATFSLITHLQNMGLTTPQADMSALCIFYLRDAGHFFAHSVISVFYSKLLRAQGNAANTTAAASEFHSVCQATASFFTLWMGAITGRFPDAVYRELFQSSSKNMSFFSGSANQTASFVKSKFRQALEDKDVYSEGDPKTARVNWVDAAKETPWYSRKSLCRFALLAASNDGAPDIASGNEGLFVDGVPYSAGLLNCRVWHSNSTTYCPSISIK